LRRLAPPWASARRGRRLGAEVQVQGLTEPSDEISFRGSDIIPELGKSLPASGSSFPGSGDNSRPREITPGLGNVIPRLGKSFPTSGSSFPRSGDNSRPREITPGFGNVIPKLEKSFPTSGDHSRPGEISPRPCAAPQNAEVSARLARL